MVIVGAFALLGMLRAIEEDAACSVYLKKTNIKTLELIPIEKLKKFAVDLS